MKGLGFLLMLFISTSLYGQYSAPIKTDQINLTYYIGIDPGFYATIQSAVATACAGGTSTVDIPYGTTPSDTIAGVTGGCTSVVIKDNRTGLTQIWEWNGTVYTNDTASQLESYLGIGYYATLTGINDFTGMNTFTYNAVPNLIDNGPAIMSTTDPGQYGSGDLMLQVYGATTKAIGTGASLSFSAPANTDGTNLWEMGRILVSPDSTIDANAQGRMYLQARGADNTWEWMNNLILTSDGGVTADDYINVGQIGGTWGTGTANINISGGSPGYILEDNETTPQEWVMLEGIGAINNGMFGILDNNTTGTPIQIFPSTDDVEIGWPNSGAATDTGAKLTVEGGIYLDAGPQAYAVQDYEPSLGVGQSNFMLVGQAASAYNSTAYGFTYEGSGSTSNYGNIQLFGGQATTFDYNSDWTMSGYVSANAIWARDNQAISTQGAYLEWNIASGTGETDFVNLYGGGVGGFHWYNGPNSTALANIMNLNNDGLLDTSGGIQTQGDWNGATSGVTSSGTDAAIYFDNTNGYTWWWDATGSAGAGTPGEFCAWNATAGGSALCFDTTNGTHVNTLYANAIEVNGAPLTAPVKITESFNIGSLAWGGCQSETFAYAGITATSTVVGSVQSSTVVGGTGSIMANFFYDSGDTEYVVFCNTNTGTSTAQTATYNIDIE